MRPKQLIKMFEALAAEAHPEEKLYYDGLCEGARQMYEATHRYYRDKQEARKEEV